MSARAKVTKSDRTETLKPLNERKCVKHSMPPTDGISVLRINSLGDLGHIDLEIKVNPRKIPTAQQKGCDPRTGRFFRKKHILAWEKCITDALRPFKTAADRILKPYDLSRGFSVTVEFCYPYPKDFPKSERNEGHPMTKTPDLDNAYKMLGDCITRSGILPDDAPISHLVLTKMYTLREPRIMIGISRNYIQYSSRIGN